MHITDLLAKESYFLRFILFLCICLCVCMYTCVCTAPRGQNRVLNALELELQAVVNHLTWVLGKNSGALQEQCVLLTLCLSSPKGFLFDKLKFLISKTVFMYFRVTANSRKVKAH